MSCHDKIQPVIRFFETTIFPLILNQALNRLMILVDHFVLKKLHSVHQQRFSTSIIILSRSDVCLSVPLIYSIISINDIVFCTGRYRTDW